MCLLAEYSGENKQWLPLTSDEILGFKNYIKQCQKLLFMSVLFLEIIVIIILREQKPVEYLNKLSV